MASTLDELYDRYEDAVSYRRENSVSKAHEFVEVCQLLLVHLPSLSTKNEEKLEFQANLPLLIKRAEAFIASSASVGGGVRHPDFSTLRD